MTQQFHFWVQTLEKLLHISRSTYIRLFIVALFIMENKGKEMF